MELLRERRIHDVDGVRSQIIEISLKCPYIVGELLGSNGVEARHIERRTVDLAGIQMNVSAIIDDVAPVQWSTGLPGVDTVQNPSAEQRILPPGGEIDKPVAAD